MRELKHELVLIPRIEFKWVHFDRWFYVNGKYHSHEHATNNWDIRDPFSFDFSDVINYLICSDKKTLRTYRHLFDGEVKPSYFKSPNLVYKLQPYFWERYEKGAVVDSVSVVKNLFICPTTGISWQYKIDPLDENPFKKDFGFHTHKRLWLFKKYLPNKNVKALHFHKNDYEKLSKPKTAFLSGELLEHWKHECHWLMQDGTDYRSFLHETYKYSKQSVVKSAARYIKKVTRIAPLSKATKSFFKSLGALAHLQKAAKYATQP